MNEKEIITKLLAIATKQQKVIHRLAETAKGTHEKHPVCPDCEEPMTKTETGNYTCKFCEGEKEYRGSRRKGAQQLAMVESDPNEDYLRRAVSAAATNAGVRTPVSATVRAYAGDKSNNTNVEGTYTVIVNGMSDADNTLKQTFIDTYKNQIKSQKPNLDGKVSILFA